jgi:GH25 family lysozyme M1 (1,4-beta-N-acetylmuramidase)
LRLLTRHPDHVSSPAIVLTALLAAIFLFTVGSVTAPGTALAASTLTSRCDGVVLRAKPSTSSTRKATLAEGVQVNALTRVTGGSWRVTCDGRTLRGNTWFRINNVKGTSAKSRYGVTYVYAATALFRTVNPTPRWAACDGVVLRSRASTSATRVTALPEGSKVYVVARVSGSSWRTSCDGVTKTGSSWYRISYVSGNSTANRYGLTYVYSATSLFSTSAPTSQVDSSAPKPTPTPTPNATATPTPNPSPTPTPTPVSGPTLTEGIDVSHWQGTIDWTRVKGAGKKFVYIKASESTSFVDNKYATNRANAKAAGLVAGAYHFAQPGTATNDAVAEADHFVNTAKIASGDLIPVLDLEVTNGMTSTALQAWVKSFLTRVYDRTGLRAGIYVSPSFWSTKMGNSSWFAANGYKVLWVAHWTTGSSPSVPANNWGGYSWTFWQYTSEGTVPGISGRVDLNRYKGTDLTKVRVP